MNRLWLKIVGCVVVVLLAAVAVYVFWPAEPSQIAKSKDAEQVQKPPESKVATEARRPKFIKSRRLRRRLPRRRDTRLDLFEEEPNSADRTSR